AVAAAPKEKPKGLDVSDIWHPGRVLDKGLNWAGRQVPLIGDADAKPHTAAAKATLPAAAPAPAGPISLLPSSSEPEAATQSDAVPAPRKPGPGSGGLY